MEFRSQVPFPVHLPGLELQAVQFPFGPIGVDTITIDDWTGPRPVVVTITVFKLGRIAEFPVTLAGLGVQAFHNFFITQAMKKDQSVPLNSRRGIALPFFQLPDQ